jgi:hypothetical protein
MKYGSGPVPGPYFFAKIQRNFVKSKTASGIRISNSEIRIRIPFQVLTFYQRFKEIKKKYFIKYRYNDLLPIG